MTLRVSIERRLARLQQLQEHPEAWPFERELCRRSVLHFFDWWVWTYDPRGALKGAPFVPFELFPRQREFIEWVCERESKQEDGACEKSRDMGFTWLCGGFAVHRWLFFPGYKTSFGSRKAEFVDKQGDPDCIFEKVRMLIRNLPAELVGPYESKENLITNISNGNTIRGEAGEDMGRGGRSTLYILDEFAFMPSQDSVEASTSQNSDVRIFGSSANGTANLFYQKTHGGLSKPQVFRLHYTDDPRKTAEWVAKEKRDTPAHIWASEMEINYAASVQGVVIPSEWVEAAVDALKKLGIAPSGARTGALDVADEGRDLNAFCGGHGVEIIVMEQWSGKNDDIFGTVEKAFALCDQHDIHSYKFDSDGLGAGVRGDARVINDRRKREGVRLVAVDAFRGSEAVRDPEREDVKGRKNGDYFLNLKAQSWWALRTRFQKTFRWVVENIPCDPNDIISINPSCGNLIKLTSELSQPTFYINKAGKLGIDKVPDGNPSPNLADAVMIRFSSFTSSALSVSSNAVKQALVRAQVRSISRGRRR